MTRIDPSVAAAVEERDDGPDAHDIRSIVRHEVFYDALRKRLMMCMAYGIVIAFIIFGPIVFLTVQVSKTGLISVPLLTKWEFQTFAAERPVDPYAGTTAGDVLATAGENATLDLAKGTVTLTLSERDVTTIVREAWDAMPEDKKKFRLDGLQVAVDAGTMEVFATTPKDGRTVPIRFLVAPSAEDGHVALEGLELKIGALRLPVFMARLVGVMVARSVNGSIDASAQNPGTLVELLAAGQRLKITVAAGGR